ncbi:MAG: ATP-dependent helicase [Bacteroidales bacterium]|nr:ATP-dependent helicase [Bacteroidales bacterium]
MANNYPDFGFTPSVYQQKIFDFIQHGTGNAVVRARAGSAKTTTMVAAMKLIPKTERCLFIAFNKSIVEELSKKLEGFPNCTVKTVHSLGFGLLQANLPTTPKLDEYKYRNYLKNNICELSEIDCESITREDIDAYIANICELVSFSRSYLCQSEREIKEIAKRYDIGCVADECKVTEKLLKWGKEHTETVDYGDMVWLPYELSMKPIGNQYDWIFNDEFQDYSKAYVDLFLRCFKRGTRFVAAMDDKQMINLFAGASGDAAEYASNYPNTHIFELPISYRCDRKIVELAKQYAPDITPRDDADEGEIIEDCHISDFKDGDMVLCRSKAPLFKLYVRLLKKGINCHIKGKDIGDNLKDLIDTVEYTEEFATDLCHDGLFPRLYDRLFSERDRQMKERNLDLYDASLTLPVLSLYDSINALNTLASLCSTTTELIERIDATFDEESKGICLSTIHKAKGLEADNVYIICRSSMPPKRVNREWEKIQEENLIYVAYTRAKHRLGFVNETEVPPAGSDLSDNAIVNDIAFIEKRVCQIYGREPVKDNASPELARFRLKNTATKVEVTIPQIKNVEKKKVQGEKTSMEELLKQLKQK